MVVITLDVSVGHHIKYITEGSDDSVQTAIDLDTAVRGLGGAVGVDLGQGGLVSMGQSHPTPHPRG